MGSKILPNKVFLDIADSISEIKSLLKRTPVDDDCAALHHLQEKLELLLLFGFIEKPGLLGSKKSYWNYICACFASSKRSHDGIVFVKSVTSLKTSLGRGRALIRFCLTHKCLADTLQSCFMDQKVSRDFYVEQSLPLQKKLWSALVALLYELNELNFDLRAGHTELDISWPKFARKCFTPCEIDHFAYKSMSTSNLHNFSSQDELKTNHYCHSLSPHTFNICLTSNDTTSVEGLDVREVNEWNEKLSQQNQSLQKEVSFLEGERLKLQSDVQNLQKECFFLQQELSSLNRNEPDKVNEPQMENKHHYVVYSTTHHEAVDGHSFSVEENNAASIKTVGLCNEDYQFLSKNLSVQPKVKSVCPENCSGYVLENDSEITALELPHFFDQCNKSTERIQINRDMHFLQNSIYITELLLEIKTAIDDMEDTVQKSDVNLVVPHISRLKKIRNSLEEKFCSEFDKSKNYFNHFVENCVSCIKNFATKQENIINSLQEKLDCSIKENQNLYSRINNLKDLLISYGFLRIVTENEIESRSIILPLGANSHSPGSSSDDFSWDNLTHDPVLKRIIVPLLPTFNSSFSKLRDLNEKMAKLQFDLNSSEELSNSLITRVQEQEIHLRGVTKELEEAQHLVSVLKKQHRKLQSAEGILKYDLQEKRKLLTRLKEQLENTREDFNRVRIKNSKSEAEWQDLHKEFIQRHKQTGEESRYEGDEVNFIDSNYQCKFTEEDSSEKISVTINNSSEISFQDVPTKKSRLEILEEQCQNLSSNLLLSAKRQQDIDKHLEVMCRSLGKTGNKGTQSGTFCNDLSVKNDYENTNEALVNSSSSDICQNVFVSDDSVSTPHSSPDVSTPHSSPDVSTPHSSPDVRSYNSECNSGLRGVCNEAHSSDVCFCESSNAESCISLSQSKLQVGSAQITSKSEQINDMNSLLDSDLTSCCTSECKYVDEVESLSCESVVENTRLSSCSQKMSLSHIDSILIRKKDIEASLSSLKSGHEFTSSSDKKHAEDTDFPKQISILEEEKKHLLCKVQELEKRFLIISAELDHTTQQLILSKASKEHEVAALQFQLNTEALKYERAFKEFSEQIKGFESMKQKVTNQEQLIFALEEALSEIRINCDKEKEQQWHELEDIHIALEVQEQECLTLCQELEKSMSDIQKEQNKNEILFSQLEDIKADSRRNKESMEAEILHLKKYSVELQKKLVKLLKEKDLLWKRNNHLYHLQKIKIDDHWMSDSEVSSCLGCRNNFSFMLRKHHCRLCGRIFCYSCADNWLLTASSRKKIRSCNECFMQYLEMRKDVRSGSHIPLVEDDSGDDEIDNNAVCFTPANNTSFNSEVPSSMTGSIITLPIIQKQSTPHFASAPDLRYVLKPDEITSCSLSLTEDHSDEREEKKRVANDVSKDAEISLDECTSFTLG